MLGVGLSYASLCITPLPILTASVDFSRGRVKKVSESLVWLIKILRGRDD